MLGKRIEVAGPTRNIEVTALEAKVAFTPEGGFTVIYTYEDDRTGTSPSFMQNYDKDGNKVGDAQPLRESSVGIAYNSEGDRLISSSNDKGVYLRYYDAETSVEQEILVAGPTGDIEVNAYESQVAFRPDGGFSIIYTYENDREGRNPSFLQSYDKSGQKVGGVQPLRDSSLGIAYNSEGDRLISSSDDKGVFLRYFDAQTSQEKEILVAGPTGDIEINAYESHVAFMPDGGFSVIYTYEDDRNGGHPSFLQTYDKDGQPAGPAQTLPERSVGLAYGTTGDRIISTFGDSGIFALYTSSQLFTDTSNIVNFQALLPEQREIVDAGADLYKAGGGSDTVTLPSSTLIPDTHREWSSANFFFGGTGNDTIYGGALDDRVLGEDDDDTIYGGNGKDLIGGGANVDTIYGGGADNLIGEDDRLFGDDGADTLYGGGGVDFLFGEHFLGFEADGSGDELHGGFGNDRLYGGGGSDFLYGDEGNDHLSPGTGDWDFVYGGADEDTVYFDKAGSDYVLTVSPGALLSSHPLGVILATDGVNSVQIEEVERFVFDNGVELTQQQILNRIIGQDEILALRNEVRQLIEKDGIYDNLILHSKLLIESLEDQQDILFWAKIVNLTDLVLGNINTLLSFFSGGKLAEGIGHVINVSVAAANYDEFGYALASSQAGTYLVKGEIVEALGKSIGVTKQIVQNFNTLRTLQELEAAARKSAQDLRDSLDDIVRFKQNQSAIADRLGEVLQELHDRYAIQEGGPKIRLAGQDTSTPNIIDTLQDAVIPNIEELTELKITRVFATEDVVLGEEDTGVLLLGSGDISATGNDSDNDITGNSGNNRLYAKAGNDRVFGMGGDDELVNGSGAGDDLYDGGEGIDILTHSSTLAGVFVDLINQIAYGSEIGTDELVSIENVGGGAGDDEIIGDHIGNEILGWGGNDILIGNRGDDTLRGGDGNDSLAGGAGRDMLFGGDGIDMLDYSRSPNSIRVDLQRRVSEGGDAEGDRFWGIEGVTGSESNDRLWGGKSGNVLIGGGGADVIYGRRGHDELDGGIGRDKLFGGSGRDTLRGGGGDDKISGGRGNDLLDGGAGNDKVKGGAGNDTFIFDSGSDKLNGGRGHDTVRFDRDFADYAVKLGKKVVITIGDDVDLLIGMERLEFRDVVYVKHGDGWTELG